MCVYMAQIFDECERTSVSAVLTVPYVCFQEKFVHARCCQIDQSNVFLAFLNQEVSR